MAMKTKAAVKTENGVVVMIVMEKMQTGGAGRRDPSRNSSECQATEQTTQSLYSSVQQEPGYLNGRLGIVGCTRTELLEKRTAELPLRRLSQELKSCVVKSQ